MRTRLLLISSLAATILLVAGCGDAKSRPHSEHQMNTSRRIEDIKLNAREQKDAVDVETDRTAARCEIVERQIREKYGKKRQASAAEPAGDTTDRAAKMRDLQLQAQHDKDAIDAEVAEKLKLSLPEETTAIQADAASRKAAIDNQANSTLEVLARDTERDKAENLRRGLDIDRDESKEIRALEQERSRSRIDMKDKKLKIDTWVEGELAKVAQDSSSDGK